MNIKITILPLFGILGVLLSCLSGQAIPYTVTNKGNEPISISMNVTPLICGTLKAHLARNETVTLDTASVCSTWARGEHVNRIQILDGDKVQFDSDDFDICFNSKGTPHIELTQGPSGWGVRILYHNPSNTSKDRT